MSAILHNATRRAAPILFGLCLAATGCSGSEPAANRPIETAGTVEAMLFPKILDVVATSAGNGAWDFAVTISSPYDTPQRYADGWQVVGSDGTVFGEQTLTHDHASEQPFTRTQTGVPIPAEVVDVVIIGRDLVHGYGGEPFPLSLSQT